MFSRSTEELTRLALLAILVLGMAGTGIELLLLKHTEDQWQLVPLFAIGVAVILIVIVIAAPRRATLRAFALMMQAFVVIGIIGTVQHFRGNVRDAGESNPSLAGVALYREALMGTTPALAPGTMLQFGLLGLLFTFRHPVLRGENDRSTSPKS